MESCYAKVDISFNINLQHIIIQNTDWGEKTELFHLKIELHNSCLPKNHLL